MLDSNNPFAKYVGYFLLAFFVMIIIFSFGMPDMTACGTADRSTVAVVNGEKIHALDFLRYRDMKFSQFRNQKMDSFILDNFLIEILQLQKAEKNGFSLSEDRISRIIKNSSDFKNPSTGKFDPEYFQAVLRQNRLSMSEYEKIMRREITISDFRFMINTGSAVSKEEIAVKSAVDSSSIQIQYAFLSNEDMKQRYLKEITVTDADIDSEIAASKVKISDPKTDREKIRKDIEEKRLDKIRNDLSEKINALASSGGSFSAAAALLNGKILKSAPFKIGQPVKTDEKEGKEITALSNSPVFMDKCLALNLNTASPVVKAPSGLYIFSPVVKTYKTEAPAGEEAAQIRKTLATGNITMVTRNLLKEMSEKSKIIKNLKTD